MTMILLANVAFQFFILMMHSLVMIGLACILLRLPFSQKRLFTFWSVNVVSRMMGLFLFPASALMLGALAFLSAFLQDYWIFGLRKRRLAIGFVCHTVIGILLDYAMLLFLYLFEMDISAAMVVDPATNQLWRTLSSLPVFGLSAFLGNVLVFALFIICYYGFRRMRHNNRWAKLRTLRPVLLTLALLAFTVYSFIQTEARMIHQGDTPLQMLADNLPLCIMLLVLIFYIVQDWRALSLSKQNRSLTQQQRMYDVLLADTRLFRHNIANMLFGFAGAVLSGDTADIQAYYSNLARKCAAINNENAVALSLVPSGAVRSFLLNKIKMADACSVPLYINVSEDIRWKSPADSDMCEMLGVFIDNALEAAKDAAAPYAAVEISNIDHAMEILIRNTYAHDADLSFLRGEPGSSKPGHEGIGLAGMRRLLSRKASVILNQLQRGRYIETSLLFY